GHKARRLPAFLWLIFFHKGSHHAQYIPDHDRVTFTSRMDPVTDKQLSMSLYAFEKGDHRNIQLLREIIKVRKTAACEKYARSARSEPFDHPAHIVAGHLFRDSLRHVVTAELDDDDVGLSG